MRVSLSKEMGDHTKQIMTSVGRNRTHDRFSSVIYRTDWCILVHFRDAELKVIIGCSILVCLPFSQLYLVSC